MLAAGPSVQEDAAARNDNSCNCRAVSIAATHEGSWGRSFPAHTDEPHVYFGLTRL